MRIPCVSFVYPYFYDRAHLVPWAPPNDIVNLMAFSNTQQDNRSFFKNPLLVSNKITRAIFLYPFSS